MTLASTLRLGGRQRKILRSCTSLGFVGLMIASGCSDEVGGDGYEPPRPTAGTNGDGGVVNAGGMDDDGGAPLQPGAGKGGSSSSSTAGKASGGKASGGKGGGTVTEGGGGAGETSGPVCGNMAIEEGEQCDDGNTKSGDGCTADCKSDCEVCEKTFCKAVHSAEAGEHNPFNGEGLDPFDPFAQCFQAEGLAKVGPAQGIAIADLCQGVVDCVRREQCAQLEEINLPGAASATINGFFHCYCSADVKLPNYNPTCEAASALDPKADPNFIGKCKREFQEASEVDDARKLFQGQRNITKALGLANLLLLTCDRSLCTEECLPQITTGAIGQIAADIAVAQNEAGESPFGNLMADSQRAATGTDFAFVRTSVFQSDYAPLGLIFHAAPGRPADAEGRLLHSELRQVIFGYYPGTAAGNEPMVGQALVTLKATGQQIYDLLEAASRDTPDRTTLQVSGLTFKWKRAQPRIEEVRKNGTLLDKAATYTVTIDSLSKNPIPGATDLVTTDKTPEGALVSYLKSLPQPISPPALDRITLSN